MGSPRAILPFFGRSLLEQENVASMEKDKGKP